MLSASVRTVSVVNARPWPELLAERLLFGIRRMRCRLPSRYAVFGPDPAHARVTFPVTLPCKRVAPAVNHRSPFGATV
jgi:hypothetical protein